MTMDLEFEFKLDEINSFLMKNLLLSQLFYIFKNFYILENIRNIRNINFFHVFNVYLFWLIKIVLSDKNCLHSNLKLNKFISNLSLNTQKILSGKKTSKYLLVKK